MMHVVHISKGRLHILVCISFLRVNHLTDTKGKCFVEKNTTVNGLFQEI